MRNLVITINMISMTVKLPPIPDQNFCPHGLRQICEEVNDIGKRTKVHLKSGVKCILCPEPCRNKEISADMSQRSSSWPSHGEVEMYNNSWGPPRKAEPMSPVPSRSGYRVSIPIPSGLE